MSDNLSALRQAARLAQRMRSYLYTITTGKTIVKLARSLQAAAALSKFAQGPLISLWDYEWQNKDKTPDWSYAGSRGPLVRPDDFYDCFTEPVNISYKFTVRLPAPVDSNIGFKY